jgi:hypothetical protein
MCPELRMDHNLLESIEKDIYYKQNYFDIITLCFSPCFTLSDTFTIL